MLKRPLILLSTVVLVRLNTRREDIIPPISYKAPKYEQKLLSMLVQEGRVGNLTAEQNDKLREMWVATLRVFGKTKSAEVDAVEAEVECGVTKTGSADTLQVPGSGTNPPIKKRGRLSRMLTRTKSDLSEAGSESSLKMTTSQTPPSVSDVTDDTDKYSQTAEFKEALATQTPQELRDQFWSMVKADHPDGLLLRFLRARKWDVQKALVMMVATMHWRGKEMDVEKIVQEGELGALENGDEQLMSQFRKGKSILHSTDLDGRPVCIVRSRLHRPAEQTPLVMERYTVHVMETCRMMLRGPVDTATVVFDLSNIEARYTDLGPVRFIIKCFEAHYPESMGICCIYGAPWFFRPIWAVVKSLLDPVVANKIRFANSQLELEAFLPKAEIIKELGGSRAWEYEYREPVKGENDLMKDTATRDRLLANRSKLVDRFEEMTKDWALNKTNEKAINERESLAKDLERDYWKLDPYIRAKTHYDRVGYIEKDGKFNPDATHLDDNVSGN